MFHLAHVIRIILGGTRAPSPGVPCHRRRRRRRWCRHSLPTQPGCCLPTPVQVLRLQRKLGQIHDGDYNALRRAYTSLCQHVSALEQEAEGMVAQLKGFETAVVPPELVAKEVGAWLAGWLAGSAG